MDQIMPSPREFWAEQHLTKTVTIRDLAESIPEPSATQANIPLGACPCPAHPALVYTGWAPAAKRRPADTHWDQEVIALGVPEMLLPGALPLARAWAALGFRANCLEEFHPAAMVRPKEAASRHVNLLLWLLLGLELSIVGTDWGTLLSLVKQQKTIPQRFPERALKQVVGRHRGSEEARADLALLWGMSWAIPWKPKSTRREQLPFLSNQLTVVIPGLESIQYENGQVELQWDSAILLALFAGLRSTRNGNGPVSQRDLQSLRKVLEQSITPTKVGTRVLQTFTGLSPESIERAQGPSSGIFGPVDLCRDVFGIAPGSDLRKVIRRRESRLGNATS